MREDGSGKKLIDAARHWAGSRDFVKEERKGTREVTVDTSVVTQLKEVGAPAHVIKVAQEKVDAQTRLEEAKRESAPPDDFEVWADCLDSFIFFQSLRGQWAYTALQSGLLIRTGIPANRLEASIRVRGIRGGKRKRLLLDIQAMEQAVIDSDIERAIASTASDKEPKQEESST